MNHRERLSTPILIAYALPYGPIVASNMAVLIFLAPLYSTQVGLSLTQVGVILFATRIWDLVTDFIIGLVSDRFRCRYGRRKPWILLGMPVLALAVGFLLLPPVGASAFYLAGWLVLFYVGYTLMLINHMAWGAELSVDYDERSRIQSWTHAVFIVFLILVLSIPALVERQAAASILAKTSAIGVFIVISLPLLTVVALRVAPERELPRSATIDLRAALRAIFRNPSFMRLLTVDFATAFYGGSISALYIFFLTDVVRVGQISGLALLVYFLASIVAIPLWLRLSVALQKHHALSVAVIVAGLVSLLWLLLPAQSPALTLAAMALAGLPFAAAGLLIRSMVADVVDQDQLRHGESRTSLFYAAYNLVNKAAVAMPLITLLPLLETFGFQAGGSNSERTLDLFRWVFAAPAVLAAVVVLAAMARYGLDREEQLRIRDALQANSPRAKFTESKYEY